MKTKIGSKLNILLIAITVLLIFVACINAVGITGSWLEDEDEVSFTINISAINIEVKQEDRPINNNDQIYIGTNIIEGDKTYDEFKNVTISNKEDVAGYYIRFKAVAKVNGIEYNINEYITSEFYNAGEWMHYTANAQSSTLIQMPVENSEKVIISGFKIPSVANDNTKLSTSIMQGKYFRLFIYIEGSPSSTFDI